MELKSQTVSALSPCVWLWNQLVLFPQRGWLMFAPPGLRDFFFLYSSPLSRLQATGSSHRERLRRSLEGTVLRCVNTACHSLAWGKAKSIQRSHWWLGLFLCSGDYLKLLFLCIFWSQKICKRICIPAILSNMTLMLPDSYLFTVKPLGGDQSLHHNQKKDVVL